MKNKLDSNNIILRFTGCEFKTVGYNVDCTFLCDKKQFDIVTSGAGCYFLCKVIAVVLKDKYYQSINVESDLFFTCAVIEIVERISSDIFLEDNIAFCTSKGNYDRIFCEALKIDCIPSENGALRYVTYDAYYNEVVVRHVAHNVFTLGEKPVRVFVGSEDEEYFYENKADTLFTAKYIGFLECRDTMERVPAVLLLNQVSDGRINETGVDRVAELINKETPISMLVELKNNIATSSCVELADTVMEESDFKTAMILAEYLPTVYRTRLQYVIKVNEMNRANALNSFNAKAFENVVLLNREGNSRTYSNENLYYAYTVPDDYDLSYILVNVDEVKFASIDDEHRSSYYVGGHMISLTDEITHFLRTVLADNIRANEIVVSLI